MKTWNERYEAMKTGLGLTDSDVAEMIGCQLHSIKCMVLPSKQLSRTMKFAIQIHEMSSKK